MPYHDLNVPFVDDSVELSRTIAFLAELDYDVVAINHTISGPIPLTIRGCCFEIAYAAATQPPSASDAQNTSASDAHRNLISNATALLRALRYRGIVISSGARTALAARAPADVINLAASVWGLGAERAYEALVREAGEYLRREEARRGVYRGTIGVVDGGERPVVVEEEESREGKKGKGKGRGGKNENGKREVEALGEGGEALSKRELKRRRKVEMQVKAQADKAGKEGESQEKTSKNGKDGLEEAARKPEEIQGKASKDTVKK
ncbi:hypothetical protein P152DRAFT_494199 [Eremomyces bilateralis CBS 781.70]|uniref:PHP domain-like protein n=1 Tax=Eremomyces bilateralis CBS 781.70 TaxID=1392243 RepID=A0A6G1FVE3_9PEZI|nr:uncharacterized protein P152DRAFT_494199 [Eremomyces bilateralis CBS 781.70]KAF1809678.1 hypothetical protein P152DRAFT_494199 [Eremomyces bilateralis CBS 781.70]